MKIALRLALLCAVLLPLLIIASYSKQDNIKPFVSDGCSMFPNGTLEQKELWLECCAEHDRAYWRGGTSEERLAADKKLEECVKSQGGPAIAKLMLQGVRAGGTPYLPTKFRWGYGWPWLRGYKALSKEEKELIQKQNRK